jgi:steroid delta-isomerase-like uncharacterized protein
MSTEENKGIVSRLLLDGYGKGDLGAVDDTVATDSIHYDDYLPEPVNGSAGVAEVISGYRTAYPDLQITVDEQIAEGDGVATRWTARGTHNGDLMGIAPTGKQITVSGIIIHRIQNGKIVEGRVSWDSLGMLQQLGAIPAGTPASTTA